MSEYTFDLSRFHAEGTEALADASAEELRVLVLLLEWGGKADAGKLAKAAGISVARAKSAIVFWREGGVLSPASDRATGNLVDEFDFRLREGVIDEVSLTETANTIRNADLSGMIEECAKLLGKATLSDKDVQNLTGLYEQYALAEDYIITLLSDMTKSHTCTVKMLTDRAIKLRDRGVDTTEKLNAYFHDRDERGEWERTLRRITGTYNRRLTDREIMLARKWVELFGYGDEVLAFAYDRMIELTGVCRLSYMDKMLSDWHEKGLHTVDECREEVNRGSGRKTVGKKKKEDKPRYGTFDPEDALNRALARSFGEDETEKKGDPV